MKTICDGCGKIMIRRVGEASRFCDRACQRANAHSDRVDSKDGGYAMSFDEIGRELGISRKRAEQLFYSGLAKMRYRLLALGVQPSDVRDL